jgi:hypothetical protein
LQPRQPPVPGRLLSSGGVVDAMKPCERWLSRSAPTWAVGSGGEVSGALGDQRRTYRSDGVVAVRGSQGNRRRT